MTSPQSSSPMVTSLLASSSCINTINPSANKENKVSSVSSLTETFHIRLRLMFVLYFHIHSLIYTLTDIIIIISSKLFSSTLLHSGVQSCGTVLVVLQGRLTHFCPS